MAQHVTLAQFVSSLEDGDIVASKSTWITPGGIEFSCKGHVENVKDANLRELILAQEKGVPVKLEGRGATEEGFQEKARSMSVRASRFVALVYGEAPATAQRKGKKSAAERRTKAPASTLNGATS